MRKRIRQWLVFGIFMMMLVAMVVMIVPTNVSAATTYYVDWDTGNNNNNGLTPATAWHDLTYALGGTSPVVTGDTIHVDYSPVNGPYKELITINKGITLIGTGITKPRIQPPNGQSGDVIKITANSVTVDNFKIRNSGNLYCGILIIGNGPSSRITSCTISNNDCINNYVGIALLYADTNTISDNNIYNNDYNGLYLKYADENLIKDNEIYDNDNDGIYLEFSHKNIIGTSGMWVNGNNIYNTATGNQQYGIHLLYSDENIIQEHRKYLGGIYKNKLDGIFLEYSDNNAFSSNKIYRNEKNGIHLYQCQDDPTLNQIPRFDHQDIYENEEHGILFEAGTSDMSLDQNEIWDNKMDGIHLDNSLLNHIDFENNLFNTATGTQQNGISFKDSAFNTIRDDNMIWDNKADGIYLDNSHNNIIENNGIFNTDIGTQQNGIHLYQSEDNIIQNHYAPPPRPPTPPWWGMFCHKKAGIFLEDCNFYTPAMGIISNQILYNEIGENAENGIHLKNSDCHQITGNYIYAPLLPEDRKNVNGIYLEDSDTITVTSNDIYECGVMITGNKVKYWNTHTMTPTNWVNTNILVYWKNRVSQPVPTSPTAGQIILAKCTNTNVIGHTSLTYGSVGILMGFTDCCWIWDNNCDNNNNYGICLWKNNEMNLIKENSCDSNLDTGIYFQNYNPTHYFGMPGIPNSLDNNDCNYNWDYGIYFHSNNDDNTITKNDVKYNDKGIYIYGASNGNTVHYNDIEQNDKYGVRIGDSGNNVIEYNNFIDNNGAGSTYNVNNVQGCDNGWSNTWDDGSSLGNYWSDWLISPNAPPAPYVVHPIPPGLIQDNFPTTTQF